MPVVRSTVSFQEKNWERLKDAQNRSQIVNEAITLYFEKEDFLTQKEEEFLEKVWQDRLDNPNEGVEMNEFFDSLES